MSRAILSNVTSNEVNSIQIHGFSDGSLKACGACVYLRIESDSRIERCLRKTLGHAKLTYEELETALIETEAILNSRPLTYVSEELTEPPFTPSHLVCGRHLLENYPKKLYSRTRKRNRHVRAMSKH